jgi:hypothetical protein
MPSKGCQVPVREALSPAVLGFRVSPNAVFGFRVLGFKVPGVRI